jgi:hypothetical protein
MKAGYARSGNKIAMAYGSWRNYSKQPYVSTTHGSRYVNNYANATARAYGKFEQSGKMPVGSVLAKDSFLVSPDGKISLGPLFLMEKMKAGFNRDSGNWRYTMIMPNGSVAGTTKGNGSQVVQFCIGCHAAVADSQDHMFFMPQEVRRN